jgi:hypothetical protein
MANSFEPERKATTGAIDDTLRRVVAGYYGVKTERVKLTEREAGTSYSSPYQTPEVLDFAGIDWVVNCMPNLIGVGMRQRDHGDCMSWRTDNGTRYPSEATRVPEAMRSGGLWPKHQWFCWLQSGELSFIWVLSTRALVEAIDKHTIGEIHQNSDGTAARYIQPGTLMHHDIVIDRYRNP